MEEGKSRFTKRLGIAATVVSLTGGTLALWNQLKPEAEIPSLSGTWVITDSITTSTEDTYIGDTHEYHVVVKQDGDKLEGKGRQKRYKDKVAKGNWPITLEAKVNGAEVHATFHIDNDAGGFDGSLTLTIDEEYETLMKGTMRTTVASQAGTASVEVGR